MIEKKIRYDINIEKPSKTKPVTQGGVLNYLGKQKTVNAPRRWRSSPDHPIAHLAYITKDEEKILIDLNLYGSLKGKPNRGPSGIMSLQGSGGGAGGGDGDGGSSGGDGGQGDSGPGGSDDGSSHGVGSGEGESTGDANDQGGTEGPGDSGPGPGGGMGFGGSEGSSLGDAPGTQGGTVGEAQAAAESVSADNQSMAAQAAQEDAATAAAAAAASEDTGIMSTLGNVARAAINAYATFSPLGIAMNAINTAIGNAKRGVTAPDDYSQLDTSVQTSTFGSPGGGGITTIPTYAPLYNPTTGDNTVDSLIAIYRKQLGY
jgi:hypothetical protein